MRGARTDVKIFHACYYGKVEKLKRMVEYGLELFTDFCNPLLVAISAGQLHIVRFLDREFDLRHQYNKAMRIALGNHNVSIIKYLSGQGADIKPESWVDYGTVFGKDLGEFKYSINMGADVSPNRNYTVRRFHRCYKNVKKLVYLVDYIFNEMKKYTLLLLVGKKIIPKEMKSIVIGFMVHYTKHYRYYQEYVKEYERDYAPSKK